MDGGTTNTEIATFVLSTDTTPQELAAALGTSYRKIKFFYYSRQISSHYQTFSINKKSGGTRTIEAPNPRLKTLQERIAKILTTLYRPRPSAKGFIANRSIVDNAKPHARKKYVFNLDLESFFNTITFARVRGLLTSKPYSLKAETASVLAHLATVNGHLPQGSPCSPIISNMICSKLDRELQELAKEHSCVYTRYADDITFSFATPLKYLPNSIVSVITDGDAATHFQANVGISLLSIIKNNGFTVNQNKVRLQSKDERQTVTGLTVNRKVNIDRRFIRKTSALIHSMAAYGLEHANALYSQKRPDASAPIEAHTQGRILFIKQVKGLENEVYRRLAIRFNALPSQFKVPVNNKQKNSDFGQSFEFAIEKKCWVLDHNDGDVQASAFMIEGNLLITCAHVFSKMNSETCSAYRIHDKFNKFTVNMVHIDKPRDIAIAKIQTQTPQAFEFFKTEETIEPNNGEKVSILGFPNVKAGATRVTRFWSTITNIFALSSVRWAQIDKEIFNGASGGPVLNSNHHVVGIVARGADDKESFNGFIMLNELNAVLQEHKNAQRVS